MTAGVCEWGGPGLSVLPTLWFSQARAAYLKVGVVLGDDVLGARLILAVPHVDVQLPLLQRQRERRSGSCASRSISEC